MQNETMVWARLPLQKAYNVRELGGLPTEEGGQTRWRAFLRADDISRLSDEDVNFLLDYGVRTVLDLRCQSEADAQPDRLNAQCGVANVNISFMEETNFSPEALKKMAEMNMGDMYVEMLKRKDTVRALFEAIAAAKPGAILFHCAAGKDRTGVLAMLLLLLAGVDKQDCVNNYIQTYQNLLRDEKYVQGLENDTYGHMLESRAEYLETAYEYVQNAGGIVAYLKSCGLAQAVLDAVKQRVAGTVQEAQAIAG